MLLNVINLFHMNVNLYHLGILLYMIYLGMGQGVVPVILDYVLTLMIMLLLMIYTHVIPLLMIRSYYHVFPLIQ